jgi:hypothetical protein
MPKERSINPAQAQRKAEKQKEIKKNKQNIQSQRNEKLARRNPERVQKQIDELKQLEKRSVLRPKDKEALVQLERDLKGILRAREALGDAAPKFATHERRERPGFNNERHDPSQNLGKRRRDEDETYQSDSDPEVRQIPMPRDTPPRFPKPERRPLDNANTGPDGNRLPHALPGKPASAAPSQAVYSSAPQLRDLTKEALKFVPAAVAQNKKKVHGQGKLLEVEEADRLEKAGYFAAKQVSDAAGLEIRAQQISSDIVAGAGNAEDIEAELQRFETEVDRIPIAVSASGSRRVQLEDVDDAGD